MERKILCPRCGKVLIGQVRFPALRPTYLYEGEVVFQVLCDSCRQLNSAARLHSVQWEQGIAAAPDMQSQLEDLLSEVWHCEADWRLQDRLDLMDRRSRGRRRAV